MNFDQVSKSVKRGSASSSQKIFQSLALDLGVRESNQYVGSGLGGNNGQLYALMSFHHKLVKDSISIEMDRGSMRWGADWLLASDMKTIRGELDTNLPVPKNTSLDDIRNDSKYSLGPNVSSWDDLTYANRMCRELGLDLDRGILSKIRPVARALVGFPMEIYLMAIRTQIGIGRLIRFNLDEHQNFGALFSAVHKAMWNG